MHVFFLALILAVQHLPGVKALLLTALAPQGPPCSCASKPAMGQS